MTPGEQADHDHDLNNKLQSVAGRFNKLVADAEATGLLVSIRAIKRKAEWAPGIEVSVSRPVE